MQNAEIMRRLERPAGQQYGKAGAKRLGTGEGLASGRHVSQDPPSRVGKEWKAFIVSGNFPPLGVWTFEGRDWHLLTAF